MTTIDIKLDYEMRNMNKNVSGTEKNKEHGEKLWIVNGGQKWSKIGY